MNQQAPSNSIARRDAEWMARTVLIAKNTRSVKLDWAVGSTHASLVWIILAAAVLGWLLGVATSVVFRNRTRSRV